MRLTERELTVALEGVAKSVLSAQDKDVRKGRRTADDAWAALTKYQRYQMLAGLGDQLLGVLVALPDVEVAIGTRPTFTNAEIEAAVQERGGEELRGQRGVVGVSRSPSPDYSRSAGMTFSQMRRRLSHDGSGGSPPQAGWLVTSRISPPRHLSTSSSAVWTT
jgi:hypothetical protein